MNKHHLAQGANATSSARRGETRAGPTTHRVRDPRILPMRPGKSSGPLGFEQHSILSTALVPYLVRAHRLVLVSNGTAGFRDGAQNSRNNSLSVSRFLVDTFSCRGCSVRAPPGALLLGWISERQITSNDTANQSQSICRPDVEPARLAHHPRPGVAMPVVSHERPVLC